MDEYITDIKEISSKKVLIFVNDEPSFFLYKNEPEKLGLKSGDIFVTESKDVIYKDLLYRRALNRALGLIRARDHTVFEISDKLKKEYYPESIIYQIIDEMKKQGFLNDRRFAENYISLYFASRSALVIKQKLLQKGIHKDVIEEEIERFSGENPESEAELITKLLQTKYKRNITFTSEHERYKFMSKVYAFLMRKGFSYEKSEKVVKDFFDR